MTWAILQRDEVPYFVSNSARLVYRITGGLALAGEFMRSAELTIEDTITTPTHWEVTLHSRSSANSADLALLWTSPNPGVHNLTFDYDDLDPGDTESCRCLVLRLKCITGATDFRFIGKAADSPHYGAAITASKIVACGADTLSPEDIVLDLVRPYTDTDQRDFPDASGLLIGQMNFTEPTTRLDMLEAVNEILRWQWGFGPDGVFTYRRPYTAANVPDRACYDLPYEVAAPSITLPLDDCYNAVEVMYTDRKDRQRKYRTTGYSEALGGEPGDTGATTRRQSILAPDNVHNAARAADVAAAYLADHLEPVPTGSITLTGTVPLLDGRRRHALHIRPGEYVYLRGAPSEEERMLRITRVEREPESQSATVEVGRNPNRLDRLLARMETKTKARRRRR